MFFLPTKAFCIFRFPYHWIEAHGFILLKKIYFIFLFFFFYGWSFASEADSSLYFKIDSIAIEIGDAFDDAKVHSSLDQKLYSIGNSLHIETRESVIKKFLVYKKGDSVTLHQLIEIERFLREQSYISDASVRIETINNQNILKVKTSDNWTIAIPVGVQKVGPHLYYGIGVQENNLLGFGKTLAFYYAHDEFRDRYSLSYQDAHFLSPYNNIHLLYSKNTDGYTRFLQMNLPYISRAKNQWSYTFQAFQNKSNHQYFWSGPLPAHFIKNSPNRVDESISVYSDSTKTSILNLQGLKEDSVSFRLAHSFGDSKTKFFLGGTYDYHSLGYDYESLEYPFLDYNHSTLQLDSNFTEDWLAKIGDSRLGFYIVFSRVRYERIKNFKNVKWNEDIDKGYNIRVDLAKNLETLGAKNRDWRLDYSLSLALGKKAHHFNLSTKTYFYFNETQRHHIYERASLEYIWHPSDKFSTYFWSLMDTYKKAPHGFQLYLGGSESLYAMPVAFYSGQARFYSHLETRYFPNIEFGTIMPVLTSFVSAGQTTSSIQKFEPKEASIMAGLGIKFALTKSVEGLINHLHFTWTLKGPLKSEYPTVTLTTNYSL